MKEAPPVRRFAGGILMAVGGLIAGLCGLCTGIYQIAFIYSSLKAPPRPAGIPYLEFPWYTPVFVGFVPILIGLGLFFLGRRLMRTDNVK